MLVINNAMLITIAVYYDYKSGFCGRLRHTEMLVKCVEWRYKYKVID